MPHFLALYTLAFVLYGASAFVVSREASWQRTLLIVGAAAIAMRVVLWGTVPSLSDDVYRYLWDGRLLTNGVSPYAFRVDSPALDYLATPNRALVNNSWMASPYFPAAQGLFGMIALFAPESALAFQVVISLVDLLTGALIATLLFRLGRSPALSLLYLWNPLVVVEFAHSAHVDAWMLALLLAGLVALLGMPPPDRRAYWAAPVLLGLASLVKPLPLLLGPVLAWRLGVRRLAVWGVVVVALSAPFVALNGLGLAGPTDGVGFLGATRIYAGQWNYNGGLYHWLETLTTGNVVPWGAPSTAPGAQAARLISGFVFLSVLAALGWTARKADTEGLLRRCLLAMVSYLLLTTTVHPWYPSVVLALVPLAVGSDRTGRPDWWPGLPWLWFSYAVAWSYLTYVGEFREFAFVRNLEYLPTLALLAFSLVTARQRGQRGFRLDAAQPVARRGP